MAFHRRRALLAAALSTLLLPATDASAACLANICLNPPPFVEVTNPGDGVICEYVKLYAPPPSDWTGQPDSPPPYAFSRTYAWGETYEHRHGKDWDLRVTCLACVVEGQQQLGQCLPSGDS